MKLELKTLPKEFKKERIKEIRDVIEYSQNL
jgi:hypothetical protein